MLVSALALVVDPLLSLRLQHVFVSEPMLGPVPLVFLRLWGSHPLATVAGLGYSPDSFMRVLSPPRTHSGFKNWKGWIQKHSHQSSCATFHSLSKLL